VPYNDNFHKRKKPLNLSLFPFCGDINITKISLVPAKIEVGVSFGPHVETTKRLEMSNRTVNNRKYSFPSNVSAATSRAWRRNKYM